MTIRVVFFTNKTARANMPLFEKLVSSDRIQLVHTVFYDSVAETRGSPWKTASQLGLHRLTSKVLELFASRVRLQAGRWSSSPRWRPRTAWELAKHRQLSHSTTANINHPTTIEFLKDLEADVLLVCICKNILRRGALTIPNLTCINVHPSLLPKYRGPRPTFWMLYHGEQSTGVTFHLMTTRIDRGAILAQRSLPLDDRLPEEEIEYQVFSMAASMVEQVLGDCPLRGLSESNAPSDAAADYFGFPTAADRRELRRRLARRRKRAALD